MNKLIKINTVLIVIAAVFLCSSCKKVLSTNPKDVIIADQYFNTEGDLYAALSGVYSSLSQDGTYGRNIPLELEMSNDEAHYNNRNNYSLIPSLYDCQASTKIYADCWTALYQGIGRANLLLANIDKSSASQKVKNMVRGEALFLRAFNYFQLVTRFGDVPLVLVPNTQVGNPNYPRTPSFEIYNRILTDMKAAEGLVNEVASVNCGTRVTKTVIEGLIARVYLKMAGHPLLLGAPAYDSARLYALTVISSGYHELNPSYQQVFINHSQDLYDNTYRESMWEIEFYGNNTPQGSVPPGSRFASQLAMRYTGSDPNAVYGYGSYMPSGILYKMYTPDLAPDSDTLRRHWNIPEYYFDFTANDTNVPRQVRYYTAGTKTFERESGKWKRDLETFSPKQRDWGPTNFPILRYADVLLMAAEAENEVYGPTQTAIDEINLVRLRALAQPLSIADVPSKEALRSFIQDERARELCFEGLRKFDLIRWGIFTDRMNYTKDLIASSDATTSHKTRFLKPYTNVTYRDTLLPIPSIELSVNALMTQNPGW